MTIPKHPNGVSLRGGKAAVAISRYDLSYCAHVDRWYQEIATALKGLAMT